MWSVDRPLLAFAVLCEDEGTFAGADENAYGGHVRSPFHQVLMALGDTFVERGRTQAVGSFGQEWHLALQLCLYFLEDLLFQACFAVQERIKPPLPFLHKVLVFDAAQVNQHV